MAAEFSDGFEKNSFSRYQITWLHTMFSWGISDADISMPRLSLLYIIAYYVSAKGFSGLLNGDYKSFTQFPCRDLTAVGCSRFLKTLKFHGFSPTIFRFWTRSLATCYHNVGEHEHYCIGNLSHFFDNLKLRDHELWLIDDSLWRQFASFGVYVWMIHIKVSFKHDLYKRFRTFPR